MFSKTILIVKCKNNLCMWTRGRFCPLDVLLNTWYIPRVAAGSKLIWDSQKSLKSQVVTLEVLNKSKIWWFDLLVSNWSQILGLPSRVSICRQLSTSTICHTSLCLPSRRELLKPGLPAPLARLRGDFQASASEIPSCAVLTGRSEWLCIFQVSIDSRVYLDKHLRRSDGSFWNIYSLG